MPSASNTTVKLTGSGGPGRGGGRKPQPKALVPVRHSVGSGRFFIPTKLDHKRVENLVLLGLTDEAIASYIGTDGIDSETLRKHFHHTLHRHRDELLGKVAASIYRQALDVKDGGDPTISQDQRIKQQHFVMKTRAGWKESDQTIINAQNVQIVKRVMGVSDDDV